MVDSTPRVCLVSAVKRVDKVIQGIGYRKYKHGTRIESLNLFLRDSIQYLVRGTQRVTRLVNMAKGYNTLVMPSSNNYLKSHWKLSENWIKTGCDNKL